MSGEKHLLLIFCILLFFVVFSFRVYASSCIDSDMGINYYLRGKVSVFNGINLTNYTDYCWDLPPEPPYPNGTPINGGFLKDKNTLVEYFCNESSYFVNYKNCEGGCYDGACIDTCVVVGKKECINEDNYRECKNDLTWTSSLSCPVQYGEQTKCRTIENNSECTRWCGDGVCSNIQTCEYDPWGNEVGTCYAEGCLSCPQDCGSCVYGVPGANENAICGFAWQGNNKWIRLKTGNIDISSPDRIKAAINEWIYSNPYYYHQIKNNQFDQSVQTLASHMGEAYYSSGYCGTTCPYPGPTGSAPTSASAILDGQCGLCADYANLWLSLLRTMNVPSSRTFVLCYQTAGSTYWGHCITSYISDSGQPWILDYGNIYSSLSQTWRCVSTTNSHWGNDQSYGWGGFNSIKCE